MNEKQLEVYKNFFMGEFPYQKNSIEQDFSKVRFRESGFITLLLRVFRFRGICFFRTIYYVKGSVKNDDDKQTFFAKMLTHTIQYRREGVLLFPFKYIINLIKNGRKRCKFNEEASYCSKMFRIRNGFTD